MVKNPIFNLPSPSLLLHQHQTACIVLFWFTVLFFQLNTKSASAQSNTPSKLLTEKAARDDFVTEELPKLSEAALKATTSEPNDNKALAASWELLRRKMTNDKAPRDEIMEFVGFVQGRLRTDLTDCWKKSMVVGFCELPNEENNQLVDELIKSKGESIAASNAHLKVEDERLLILTKSRGVEREFKFSVDDLKAVKLLGGEAMAVIVDERQAFVVDLSTRNYRSIKAFEPAVPTKTWTSTLFGPAPPGVIGRPLQVLEMYCDENRLFVLGSGTQVFLEAFDRKTGQPLIRFSATPLPPTTPKPK